MFFASWLAAESLTRSPWPMTFFRRPVSLSTFRIFVRDSARGGTIGSRYVSSINPIAAIAAFTGIGLDSTKLISINGSSAACIWRAAAKSPRSAASTICDIWLRRFVRRYGNDAAAPNRHQRKRDRIVSGERR